MVVFCVFRHNVSPYFITTIPPTVFAKFSGGKSPKYTGIQLGQIWYLLWVALPRYLAAPP